MNLRVIGLRLVSYLISHIIYMMNKLRWKKPAKPEKIIWIKPDDIIRSIEFSSIVQQRRYYLNGIIMDGAWGKDNYTVFKLHDPLFKSFYKRFKKKIPFLETEYFQNRNLSGKNLKRLVRNYNTKYNKIYRSIKNEGFKVPKSIFDEMDTFKVSIASNGDLLFMTGKHRLAIAKLMGDDFKIPVKISHRHADWQKYRDKLHDDYQIGKVTKEEIREIGHPDLLDIIGE